MIERKDLNQVTVALRQAFLKAQDSLKKNNADYAIEILKDVVSKEPGFLDARKMLRDAEKGKSSNLGAFAKMAASAKIALLTAKAKTYAKKKPIEAMQAAEDALAMYLYAPSALTLLIDAAEAAGGLFIAVEAAEILRDSNPKNEGYLKILARLYEANNQPFELLQTRQKIADLKPEDLEAQAAVRAAAALASMKKGKWEGDGDLQSRLKSKDEAASLEQEDRIVRNVDDVNDMIVRLEKAVADGDESIDNRRKLADLYQRAERFDDSIAAYEWIANKLGVLDPSIDKAIEKSIVAKYDKRVASMREGGSPDADIEAVEAEKYNYRMERAVDRVNKYPNDTELRYQLAVVYWDGGHVDHALEQFQLAQKNPHRRLSAIVYLGRCFHAKSQLDLSIEQFSRAVSEMQVMDRTKMDALYYMGSAYEDQGDVDNAMACFKQIYQANINFKDVAQRMEKFYKKK